MAKHVASPPVGQKVKVRLVLPFRMELISLPTELRKVADAWREHLLIETGLDLELSLSWSSAGASLLNIVRGRTERRR